MRTLEINKRPAWYANYLGKQPILDDDNYETGEYGIAYTTPVLMFANVSPARGESNTRQFGELVDYDKVIVFDGRSPVTETSLFWIDNLADGEIPDIGGEQAPHDYIVKKVAESLNSTSIAVSKVTVSR